LSATRLLAFLKAACGHGGNSAEQKSVSDLLSGRKYVFRSHVFVPFFQSAEFVEMIEKQSSLQQGSSPFLSASPVPVMLFRFALSVALQHSILLNVEEVGANYNVGKP